jgi:hypothetical protein
VREDWVKSDLWRQTEGIPGATVCGDADGMEAHLFRAESSGQTLFYDSEGVLMFQGGITSARGHSGDNAGRDAIVAFAGRELSNPVKTPVFGCGLFERQ